MDSKLMTLIKSRKFWAAVVGLVLVIVRAWRPDFPLSEDELTRIVAILVAYILGTGLEGGMGRKAGNSAAL